MLLRTALLCWLCAGLLTSASAADDAVISHLRDTLSGIVNAEPDSIEKTPIDGIYEVAYGTQIFYATQDARYVFRGGLVDLKNQTSLTEQTQNRVRRKKLNQLDEDNMIVFSPKQPEHTITVFTDTECPYCRKLHAEMGQLNDAGIKVRYMMFPRAGIDSSSYRTAVHIWCADDPREAMTRAKQGESIKQADCENPVKQQYKLGQQLGVHGTPAILLEDGTMLTGYRSAKRLDAMLARHAPNDAAGASTAAAR